MNALRLLFNHSREAVWRQLSQEVGGRYEKRSWLHSDRVDVTHGEWTITLDSYTVNTGKMVVVYTRLRAPYVNPDRFRFTVYREGLFSEIAKRLGMQDIEVGHPAFDRDFIIKGNDPEKLRALFAHEPLRTLLSAQPKVHFMVKDNEGFFGKDFPPHTDELSFVVAGLIKDVTQLKQLFVLFAETLDQLCRIGAAYEGSPGVRL